MGKGEIIIIELHRLNFNSTKTNNMEKQFIPYKQALELKELGFRDKCFACYDECKDNLELDEYFDWNNPNIGAGYECKGTVSAPLWQQAFDWFREVYSLECYIYSHKEQYCIIIKRLNAMHSLIDRALSEWDTYDEAKLVCLDWLIKLGNSETKMKNDGKAKL